MPTALIPAFEEWGNRSFFNDRPIIPYDREKVLPEYQYTPYTTETAKFISSKFGNVVGKENTFSPAILENYIRGWTGGTGRYLLEALDFSMRKMGIVPDPVKPKDTLADVPFVRAFTLRQPSAGSESIQRFYDDYDEVETYLNSFRSLKKEMNIQGMQELSIYKAYSAVEPLKGMLAEQSKMIRMISADPSMSPDEKRQLIDNIYLGMIEIAKKGRRNLKMIKEKLKEVNQ